MRLSTLPCHTMDQRSLSVSLSLYIYMIYVCIYTSQRERERYTETETEGYFSRSDPIACTFPVPRRQTIRARRRNRDDSKRDDAAVSSCALVNRPLVSISISLFCARSLFPAQSALCALITYDSTVRPFELIPVPDLTPDSRHCHVLSLLYRHAERTPRER